MRDACVAGDPLLTLKPSTKGPGCPGPSFADMNTYLIRNGKVTPIKNLGWLLRNWQQVKWLGFNWERDGRHIADGQLVAKFKDGGAYFTDYVSLSVCWRFLNRPVFRGLPFRLCRMQDGMTSEWTIGDDAWRGFQRLGDAGTIEALCDFERRLDDLCTIPLKYEGRFA